ncbi:uncharacterized protein [Nicotiana tomentosiformis]|uniref:uncharacterized protein n=1 Tax=Nicotiana tomentosiformis TaxID=4098 RepID=UPI00051AB30D|nr:uncharacterized protein LOC104091817 [Nicotiana tomentosiformis]
MEAATSNINGKIWLFLDAMVQWDVVIDTDQQLTIMVYHQDIENHIMMTFVYAKCSSLERLELWDNLYYLDRDMELPWVVGGDFNMILNEEEKIGGLPVYPPEYEDFVFYVNSCGLFDMGYKGSPFIWWNGRPNSECIFKRLDRSFVNMPFQTLFPSTEVEHYIRTGFDHAPLLMSSGKQSTQIAKTFKFLNFWIKHASFMEKLKRVKIALSKWSKLTYGDIFKQLALREDAVRVKEMIFEEEPTVENRIVLQKAQFELKRYLSIEEQQKLQLKRIQNQDGAWIKSQDQLADAAVEFYQK